MGSNNTIERFLNLRQVDQLEDDLRIDRTVGGERQSEACAGAHLTDEEFFSCLGEREGAGPPALREHVLGCPQCSTEMRRLRDAMLVFEEVATVSRIRRRLPSESADRLRPQHRPTDRLADTLTGRLARLIGRVSIAPLFAAPAASAAGVSEDLRIEFPVTESGELVPGLRGVMMRRSSEYYAKIEADDDTLLRRFRERRIRLVIAEQEEDFSILEREIPVGIVVFIGTGLKKTYDLSAELV